MDRFEWIATAAFGLEGLVARELARLGIEAKAENGGARFFRANLHARCADRILLVMGRFEARSFEALFEGVRALPWEDFIGEHTRFPVNGKCARSQLMSVRDCQAITKKAIVERLRGRYRTDWFAEDAETVSIDVALHGDVAQLTLDASGTALNRRGYRTWNGEAPLRETLAAALLAGLLVLPAAAEETADAPNLTPEFSVTAEAAYVANTDTGLVVYEKNSETPMAAASLTKLMTMILMLESYQDQLDTISITAPGYIYDYLYGKNASTADIWKDETHTLRSLLYAMLLPSANEAAYIVADYMSGSSIDNFVAMMNDEAARIGCTGTTFTDPCGLDPGNVTTARDAYLLVRVAMGYDAFAQAAGEESYQMPASTKHDSPYTILTSDKLVSPSSNYYRSYTKGGKTGSLDDWQNFAGWHTQDGETYVSVVLHSPKTDEDPRPALTETAELMDWAFATFTVTAALDTTQPITELPIVYSSQTDTVMIYPADDMQTLLPRQGGAELTEKTFNVPEHLSAPIKQGDVVGTVTVTMQGETVGTVDLLAGSSVDRNELLYTMAKVKAFFSSTYFKVVVVLCIIAAVVYAVLWVYVMLLTVRRVEQPTPKRKNKPNDWNKE